MSKTKDALFKEYADSLCVDVRRAKAESTITCIIILKNNMDMHQIKLSELEICQPAQEWLEENSFTSFAEVLVACERGDWLLRLAGKVGVDRRQIVLAAGLIANTVRHLMEDERSTAAVDVAIAYGNGEASEEELTTAADAAWAASAASAAWWAADAAASAAAKSQSLRNSAEICREIFGSELLNRVAL